MQYKLKELRTNIGETVEDVAKKVGISKSYYSMIENGKRPVSYKLAFKIASVFNLKPDDIFLQFELTESKLLGGDKNE